MRFIEIGEGDRRRFNEFVGSSPGGHIFQSYEWGEVKRGDGWTPLRFTAEEGGEIKAAVQLLQKKILSFSILYAPRGPVLDHHDAAVYDFLLAELEKQGAARRAIFFQMDPDVGEGDAAVAEYLGRKGFIARPGGFFRLEQPRSVFRLDLRRSAGEIFDGFTPSARRDIRIAERNGVVCAAEEGPEALERYYALLRNTGSRKNFLVRPYSFQKRLYGALAPRGMAKLYFARYRGEDAASALVCSFGRKSWYMYAGTGLKYPKLNAGCFLVWEIIKRLKEGGCEMFDLRGAGAWDLPGHPERGVYEFKRKFSPDFCRFIGECYLVFRPGLFSAMSALESVLRRLLGLFMRVRGLLRPRGGGARREALAGTVLEKYGRKEEIEGYTRRTLAEGLGFEEKFIGRHMARPGHVLVAGCGAGREAVYFAKKGFAVSGIDVQPGMVEAAAGNMRASGVSADLRVMDAARLGFADGTFDYCVMLGVAAYMPGRENRVAALREVRRVMKKGGLLVISVPSKKCGLKYIAYFAVMDNLRKLMRRFLPGALEPGDRFSRTTDPGIVSAGKTFFHMFSYEEMAQDLAAAGLEPVECLSRREIMAGVNEPERREKDYFMYFCARKA